MSSQPPDEEKPQNQRIESYDNDGDDEYDVSVLIAGSPWKKQKLSETPLWELSPLLPATSICYEKLQVRPDPTKFTWGKPIKDQEHCVSTKAPSTSATELSKASVGLSVTNRRLWGHFPRPMKEPERFVYNVIPHLISATSTPTQSWWQPFEKPYQPREVYKPFRKTYIESGSTKKQQDLLIDEDDKKFRTEQARPIDYWRTYFHFDYPLLTEELLLKDKEFAVHNNTLEKIAKTGKPVDYWKFPKWQQEIQTYRKWTKSETKTIYDALVIVLLNHPPQRWDSKTLANWNLPSGFIEESTLRDILCTEWEIWNKAMLEFAMPTPRFQKSKFVLREREKLDDLDLRIQKFFFSKTESEETVFRKNLWGYDTNPIWCYL